MDCLTNIIHRQKLKSYSIRLGVLQEHAPVDRVGTRLGYNPSKRKQVLSAPLLLVAATIKLLPAAKNMPTHNLCQLDSRTSPSPAFVFPNHQQISTYRPLARICTAFIQQLFQQAPASTPFFSSEMYSPLPFLIAHILSQSPLDPSSIFATLSLLYRYRSRCPRRHIKLRDPSRLFTIAYILTTKLLSDKSYPMRTWASLAQNNYDIHELMDMEREFCLTLDWELGLDAEVLGSLKIIFDAFLSPDIEIQFRTSTTSKVSDSSSTEESSQSLHEPYDDEWVWMEEDIERSGGDVTDLDGGSSEIDHQFEYVQARSSVRHPSTAHRPVKPAKFAIAKRLSNIFS